MCPHPPTIRKKYRPDIVAFSQLSHFRLLDIRSAEHDREFL
jgi:hypothetical protein